MKQLNAFHTISITGIIFSLFCHLILLLINQHVPNYWYLYPTWVLVFLFGYLWNVIDTHDDHHH